MRDLSQIRLDLNTTNHDQYANCQDFTYWQKSIQSYLWNVIGIKKSIAIMTLIRISLSLWKHGGSCEGHLHTFLDVRSSSLFLLSLFLFRTWFLTEAGYLLLCLVSCSDFGHSSGPSPWLFLLLEQKINTQSKHLHFSSLTHWINGFIHLQDHSLSSHHRRSSKFLEDIEQKICSLGLSESL